MARRRASRIHRDLDLGIGPAHHDPIRTYPRRIGPEAPHDLSLSHVERRAIGRDRPDRNTAQRNKAMLLNFPPRAASIISSAQSNASASPRPARQPRTEYRVRATARLSLDGGPAKVAGALGMRLKDLSVVLRLDHDDNNLLGSLIRHRRSRERLLRDGKRALATRRRSAASGCRTLLRGGPEIPIPRPCSRRTAVARADRCPGRRIRPWTGSDGGLGAAGAPQPLLLLPELQAVLRLPAARIPHRPAHRRPPL